jgi:hypothetical protein
MSFFIYTPEAAFTAAVPDSVIIARVVPDTVRGNCVPGRTGTPVASVTLAARATNTGDGPRLVTNTVVPDMAIVDEVVDAEPRVTEEGANPLSAIFERITVVNAHTGCHDAQGRTAAPRLFVQLRSNGGAKPLDQHL